MIGTVELQFCNKELRDILNSLYCRIIDICLNKLPLFRQVGKNKTPSLMNIELNRTITETIPGLGTGLLLLLSVGNEM